MPARILGIWLLLPLATRCTSNKLSPARALRGPRLPPLHTIILQLSRNVARNLRRRKVPATVEEQMLLSLNPSRPRPHYPPLQALKALSHSSCSAAGGGAWRVWRKRNSSKLIFSMLLALTAAPRPAAPAEAVSFKMLRRPSIPGQLPHPTPLFSSPGSSGFWRVIDFMLLLLMVFFLWFKLISIMHKY